MSNESRYRKTGSGVSGVDGFYAEEFELPTAEIKARVETIATLLAESGISSNVVTEIAMIHLVVCGFLGDGQSKSQILLNVASLVATSLKLAGADNLDDSEQITIPVKEPS